MDPGVAPEIRETFYQNNPIPGTIWSVRPDGSHVLDNPDDVIPPGYTADNLRDDITDYSRMHTWLQKKIPKYVRTERLNYEEKGSCTLFVSNRQNRLRIRDRRQGQTLREYYDEIKLEGNIYDFWSPRDLKKIEQLTGQLNLLGELPSLANFVYPYYVFRDIRNSAWHYSTDYKGSTTSETEKEKRPVLEEPVMQKCRPPQRK
jgi:hypothetical protein